MGFSQGFIASAGRVDTAFSEGLFRMFSAAIAFSVGEITGHDLSFSNLLAHGISQGAIAPIRGGSFRSGFISAIISKLSGAVVSKIDTGVEGYDKILSGSIVALFGGLGSEATGGSFQEGAMRALAVYLFNDMAWSSRADALTGAPSSSMQSIYRWLNNLFGEEPPSQFDKSMQGLRYGFSQFGKGFSLIGNKFIPEGIQAYKNAPSEVQWALGLNTAFFFTPMAVEGGGAMYYGAMMYPERVVFLGETVVPIANDVFNESMPPSTFYGQIYFFYDQLQTKK